MDVGMFLQVWGSELCRVREVAGLSQQELAKRLNTTQKQISRLENGENMNLGTIFRWYTACGVAPPIPDNARG